ncbi:MAG: hypothetical protein V1860_01345 [bacterium]
MIQGGEVLERAAINIKINMEEHKNSFKINYWNIIIITFFLVFITAILTLFQPLKYESSSRFLLVRNYDGIADGSKSVQYLSDILAKVIYSTSFLNEVLESGFNVDKKFFSNGENIKKQWEKTVQAKTSSDTGIISVDVFHKNKEQAIAISQAIGHVLETKHMLYHGGGNNVSIIVIDKPITTKWPVKPNIIVNLILALIFGIISSIGFIYFLPDYDIGNFLREIFFKGFGKKLARQSGEAGAYLLKKEESEDGNIDNEEYSYLKKEFQKMSKLDNKSRKDYTREEELYDDFDID